MTLFASAIKSYDIIFAVSKYYEQIMRSCRQFLSKCNYHIYTHFCIYRFSLFAHVTLGQNNMFVIKYEFFLNQIEQH